MFKAALETMTMTIGLHDRAPLLHLLKVYVDDENVACEALPQGVRLIDGTVTVVESEIEIAQDFLIPADIRTSKYCWK